MLFALAMLSFAFAFFGVVLPIARFTIAKQQAQSEMLYKAFQVVTIREYYPELRETPYHELAKQYDLDLTYHRINWSRPSR